ncbi:MAG: catalase [Planctomycetota bacterium]|nr:catalase [Planctomycetota bacterium]
MAVDSFISSNVRLTPAFDLYAPPPNRQIRETGSVVSDPTADHVRDGYEATPESAPFAAANSEQAAVRNDDAAEDDETSRIGGETDARGEPLDDTEQIELDKLQARDHEVRRHEQAHKAAGGRYAGAISYDYAQGPDGKRYAVGGEVSIDISPEREPEATIAKMRQVKAAATAPAKPSAQDRAVAAEAARIEMRARQELRRETGEKLENDGERNNAADSSGENGENTRVTAFSDAVSDLDANRAGARQGRQPDNFAPPAENRRSSLDITI